MPKPLGWIVYCNGQRREFTQRKAMREYRQAMLAAGHTVSVRVALPGGASEARQPRGQQ